MPHAGLIEQVANPLVRAFLQEHLDEFADDVQVFSEEILAHVPSERKAFIRSSGLAFYSTPIVNFVPDIPWQTIKTAIANAVSGVFRARVGDRGSLESRVASTIGKSPAEAGRIEQAIVAAFASVCKSAQGALGAILIGGLAHLLGKYIALTIAGIVDETAEHTSWPVVQPPPTGTRPPD